MKHTGRVIHHAEGIDGDGEALFTEPAADSIGKAGPDKEHFLAGLYFKSHFGNINDRSKLHNYERFVFLHPCTARPMTNNSRIANAT